MRNCGVEHNNTKNMWTQIVDEADDRGAYIMTQGHTFFPCLANEEIAAIISCLVTGQSRGRFVEPDPLSLAVLELTAGTTRRAMSVVTGESSSTHRLPNIAACFPPHQQSSGRP